MITLNKDHNDATMITLNNDDEKSGHGSDNDDNDATMQRRNHVIGTRLFANLVCEDQGGVQIGQHDIPFQE